MSGEWQKSTILDLIATYRINENLYNPKHKLYYNKQARSKSLDNILQAVRKSKSDVTVNDVIKKIQILRTQFGQEVNKIEKSKSLGDELTYVPKIWWFKSLEFISKYMKMRSQPSTPLSVKLEQKAFNDNNETDETLFELVEANEEELETSYNEQDDLNNKSKKRRIEFSSNIINSSINQNSDSLQPQTIEYIINEDTSELIPTNEQVDERRESDHKFFDNKRFKKKCKAFGTYVGCLMQEFNDDRLFYEAQNEILRVIEKTALKMVQK